MIAALPAEQQAEFEAEAARLIDEERKRRHAQNVWDLDHRPTNRP